MFSRFSRVASALSRQRRWLLVAFALTSATLASAELARPLPAEGSTDGIGHLRITADTTSAERCAPSTPASGTLVVRSLDERASTQVLGSELARVSAVRRALPAGLYSVSWLPTPSADGAIAWQLREPKVFNVFAGRVTELRVQHEASGCESADHRP